MPATRDGKTWRSQFYYEDWQGVRHKKNKRGFKTKAEAEEWERNFRQQQQKDLDINFENFVEIYFADMENRLRESTIKNKRYVFDLRGEAGGGSCSNRCKGIDFRSDTGLSGWWNGYEQSK